MAVKWVPWSGSWQWWQGNRDLRSNYPLAAIDHYKLSIRLQGSEEGLLDNISIAWTQALDDAMARGDEAGAAKATEELQKATEALAAYKGIHPPTSASKGDSDSDSASDHETP